MLDKWQNFPKQISALYRPTEIRLYKENGTELNQLYISRPASEQPGPTIIWFHGGGLTGDPREYPAELYDGVNTVIEARYPVFPQAQENEIISDATQAIAWCFQHLHELGRIDSQFFVGGMSAGAYLTAIICLDPSWLASHGIDNHKLAGIIAISGQMTTHFKIKAEHGLSDAPVIDDLAPIKYVSKDLPPILLVTGESGLDMPARPEENAFMAASLRAVGHTQTFFYSLPGHEHSSVLNSSGYLMLKFIKSVIA